MKGLKSRVVALVAALGGAVCLPSVAYGRAVGIANRQLSAVQIVADDVDWTELADAMTLDAATTITGAGANTLAITTPNWSITAAGVFVIADLTVTNFTATGNVTMNDPGADTILIGATADTVTIAGAITVAVSAGADTVTIGDADANVAITDPQWSVTGAGAATFGGLITGSSGATISGAAVTANAGLTVVGPISETGVATFTPAAVGTEDQIIINPGAVGAGRFAGTITTADLTVARSYTLPNDTGSFALGPTAGPVAFTGPTAARSYVLPDAAGNTIATAAAALTANAIVLGGGAGAVSALGSLGTTTTLLHGNVAGAPTFGAVVAADVTDITRTVPLPLSGWQTCTSSARILDMTSAADAAPDWLLGSGGATDGSLAIVWDVTGGSPDTDKICANIPIPTDYVSGATVRLYFIDTATNDHTHTASTLAHVTGSAEDTVLTAATTSNGPSGTTTTTTCDGSGVASAVFACDFASAEAVALVAGNVMTFSYARAGSTEALTLLGAEFRYTATE